MDTPQLYSCELTFFYCSLVVSNTLDSHKLVIEGNHSLLFNFFCLDVQGGLCLCSKALEDAMSEPPIHFLGLRSRISSEKNKPIMDKIVTKDDFEATKIHLIGFWIFFSPAPLLKPVPHLTS